MAFFDKPLGELQTYWPDIHDPADFEDFWRSTIAQAREHDVNVRLEKVDNRLSAVEAFDVTFAGFGGQDVKAWLFLPAGAAEPLPTVVEYIGYGGGRGLPIQTLWPSAGCAHFLMDTRGQGWSTATDLESTADLDLDTSNGVAGMMTRGIGDKATYYLRRLFTDAFRAIDAARSLEQVDETKIILRGGSQGGGMVLAAAGLAGMHEVPLVGAMPDVPFLCHFDRAITLTDAAPYKEVSTYLASRPGDQERVLETLSYHDGVNFARRASCPTLFSVGLMDQVCPPSTVYAAFNAWGDPDQTISVYPHNGHEGGRELHLFEQLKWVEDHLAAPKGRSKRPRRGLRR